MFTLQDIQNQLAGLFGNGATAYAAPDPMAGMTATGGLSGNNAVQTFGTPAATAGSGFGMNLGTLGAGIQGLNALSGLIQGNKAYGLAKDQFKFQKNLANTNLNNSIKSYNTALEDRLTARGKMQGDDPILTQEQIDRNKLTR